MPKPFANSAQITYSLVNGDWLLGIQTGNSTGDAGLPQMKHIKLSQLSDWVRGTYGQIWRYRGPFSASLPSDAQANDYFLATATFTVDGVTYTKDHLYAYSTSGTWDDISDVLSQYASQAQVTDIDDRLTAAEEKIDSMGDGIVYKGKVATYADLAGIADPQRGWEYYVTDDAAFYVYNGASWDPIDNGIVQTITDGDTSHAPSADAVHDALASEASAREAADSNLKSAIRKDEARITNLEEKADPTGAYKTVNYRGTNAVPTGKAKYGLVESIVGKSRAWNRLIQSSVLITGTYSDVIFSVSDGVMSLNGTASGNAQIQIVSNDVDKCVEGHKYLLIGGKSDFWVRPYDSLDWDSGSGVIFTAQSADSLKLAGRLVNGTVYNESTRVFARDLTLIFPEGVPSTVAECVQKCPSILDYDAYGYSLPSTTVSGVKFNNWNYQWEVGAVIADGTIDTSLTSRRTSDYIPCEPETSYTQISPDSAYTGRIAYYGANKNYLSYDSNGIPLSTKKVTTPAYAKYMRVTFGAGYGTENNRDIVIIPTSFVGQNTLSLPSSVTLRSAGSVADEVELNVEVNGVAKRRETQRVTTYSFTGSEGWTWDSVGFWYMSGYTEKSKFDTVMASNGIFVRTYTNSNIVRVYSVDNPSVSSATTMNTLFNSGTIMNYATYEEVVTLLDPIENNTIQTEGGGTINTIQTQTTKIDNCLDVGYLAL